MTDAFGATAAPAAAPTAGRLLRQARERQGLHIAALAASIKVAPKKLELLEADRFDELPDATFTRALAQTVCRALKTDAAPVMRLLPPPAEQRLDQVGEGLNAPFRERPGVLVQREGSAFGGYPALGVALLLLAALAIYFVPAGVLGRVAAPRAAASTVAVETARVPAGEAPGMPPDAALPTGMPPLGATVVSAPASAAPAVPQTAAAPLAPPLPVTTAMTTAAAAGNVVASAERIPAAAAPAPLVNDSAAPLLQVQTSGDSWVEVTDARGKALLARLLRSGESVGVDGAVPLRVRIGNAGATRLVFRGQPADLSAVARDNVARLELK